MDSVTKARRRFRQYPVILAKCSKEASNYAKCVLKQDNIALNDCNQEFQQFKTCLKSSAAKLKTKL